MRTWTRDTTNRLIRINSLENKMATPEEEVNNPEQPPLVLMDRCYPPRTAQPSCIRLPAPAGNQYEIKPQYISMLPKFSGLDSEDAYIFINEFEEVCAMF
jgi:hypothetical protein